MDLPPIDLMINAEGAPMVRVSYEAEYTDIPTLIGALPMLREPAHAEAAAGAVNHLSEGFGMGVITDPDAFRAAYLEQLETEKGTEWQQGTPRLSDFGMPNLSEIATPNTDGDTLTFFADDKYLGIAYRVSLSFASGEAQYEPVPAGGPLPD